MTPTILTYTLFFIALFEALIALLLIRQRDNATALPLALIFLACAIYSAAYAGELLAMKLHNMLFWSSVQYIGIVAIPPSWLFIAMRFTGSSSPALRRLLGGCFAFSFVIFLLHATDQWHGLLYAAATPFPIGPNSTLNITHGPAYILFGLYMYACFSFGCLLIWRQKQGLEQALRKQSYALLGAITFPILGNLLYWFQISPYPHLDLSPFSTALTAFYTVIVIFLFDVFNFFPLAFRLIVETFPKGVLIFNKRNRLVFMNPTAKQLLTGAPLKLGMPLEALDCLGAAEASARFSDPPRLHQITEAPPPPLDPDYQGPDRIRAGLPPPRYGLSARRCHRPAKRHPGA